MVQPSLERKRLLALVCIAIEDTAPRWWNHHADVDTGRFPRAVIIRGGLRHNAAQTVALLVLLLAYQLLLVLLAQRCRRWQWRRQRKAPIEMLAGTHTGQDGRRGCIWLRQSCRLWLEHHCGKVLVILWRESWYSCDQREDEHQYGARPDVQEGAREAWPTSLKGRSWCLPRCCSLVIHLVRDAHVVLLVSTSKKYDIVRDVYVTVLVSSIYNRVRDTLIVSELCKSLLAHFCRRATPVVGGTSCGGDPESRQRQYMYSDREEILFLRILACTWSRLG